MHDVYGELGEEESSEIRVQRAGDGTRKRKCKKLSGGKGWLAKDHCSVLHDPTRAAFGRPPCTCDNNEKLMTALGKENIASDKHV